MLTSFQMKLKIGLSNLQNWFDTAKYFETRRRRFSKKNRPRRGNNSRCNKRILKKNLTVSQIHLQR
jgi:hypothetical protein